MSQEDGEKFLATLDDPPSATSTTGAVPDDQFDDSYDQIKHQ